MLRPGGRTALSRRDGDIRKQGLQGLAAHAIGPATIDEEGIESASFAPRLTCMLQGLVEAGRAGDLPAQRLRHALLRLQGDGMIVHEHAHRTPTPDIN